MKFLYVPGAKFLKVVGAKLHVSEHLKVFLTLCNLIKVSKQQEMARLCE